MRSATPDVTLGATRRNLQERSRRNHHEQSQFRPAMACDSDVRPWMGRHHTIWRAFLIGNFSVRLERGRLIRGSRRFRSSYSGNSIRSECFLSRSCSSAKTFSSHFACFSATHLSTDCGLCPMKNSSPQPSHLSVPISCKPVVFSRPLFFIATARMFQF